MPPGLIGQATYRNSYAELNLTHLTRIATRPKYFNEITEYDGIRYHSKREAEYAQQLDAMRHAQRRDRVEGWNVRFDFRYL